MTEASGAGGEPQPAAPSTAAPRGSGNSERYWLKDLSTLLGAIGASIGLIYATGGLVLGVRLFVHHFSFGPVIGQLPRQFLLSFGFSEVVLPAAVVAAVLTGIRYDWKAVVALGAGFVLVLILSLILLELRAIIYTGKRELTEQVALMTLLVGVWSMPGLILLWANIELPAALLCTTGGDAYKGVLIGETADRDYLGANPQPTDTVRHHRLISLPLSQVEALFVGRDADKLSCPLSRR
jgi:hypothetical protein